MVIYLKHAKHGTKVACMEEEALADEKNGWERYSVDDVKALDSFAERVLQPRIENMALYMLRQDYQAKFGKKPHHKKTVEILKQELAA